MANPPNTLLYGFYEPSLAAAADELAADGSWQVVHWIGVNNGVRRFDECIHSWHLHGIAHQTELTSDNPVWSALANDLWVRHGRQVQEQLARNVFCANFQADDFKRLHELLVAHFGNMLLSRAVDLALFQNLPHEGFELVLYLVAKKLGVMTVLCYQSILPNRFFFCFDLDDFGRFQSAASVKPAENEPLPQGFRKELFYMRDVQTRLAKKNNLRQEAARQWLFAKIGFKLFKQRIGWYERLRLRPPRIPLEQRFEYELDRTTCRRVDWNQPFVYFPLHLQPELSTSAIGDGYSDQLKAITELSDWVPRDWQILVKENPKQTYSHRPPEFFERLRRLPNIRLVDRAYDTYQLLERCQIAATITGTVGWEAISGGKPVLVFGHPWYLTLPGVFRWPVDISAVDLAGQQTCHKKLEGAFSELVGKTRLGILDSNYQASLKHFEPATNTSLVADFFREQVTKREAFDAAPGHMNENCRVQV